LSQEINSQDLSEIIAESFGANATYVEGLLGRYRSNPALVDEAWRAYFAELLGDGAGAAAGGNGAAAAAAQPPAEAQAETQTEPVQQQAPAQASTGTQASAAPAQAPAAAQVRGEAQPIRGGALKIVENMEASLTVPTATSNRQVPVKVLEENRALVNQYLKEHKRGKASYTHFVAYAILRAVGRFPQMNDGFAVVDGQPARVRRADPEEHDVPRLEGGEDLPEAQERDRVDGARGEGQRDEPQVSRRGDRQARRARPPGDRGHRSAQLAGQAGERADAVA